MSARVAINGLGGIGRATLKILLDEPALELVAVNDIASPENLDIDLTAEAVRGVMWRYVSLRTSTGKEVFDIKPRGGDKGRAMLWLLNEPGLAAPEVVPLSVGDDVTDEDAFRRSPRPVSVWWFAMATHARQQRSTRLTAPKRSSDFSSG